MQGRRRINHCGGGWIGDGTILEPIHVTKLAIHIVKVNKVGTLENFNRALTRLREDRRKAENVLLDDIEVDVLQKEKFLTEQIANLKEMSENYNNLIESKRVITVVS
jgi:hypothetical protein